jgi:hypothetical protein
MINTTTKPQPTSTVGTSVNRAGVGVARLSLSKRQRRPGYVALLVLLVVGLAAVGGWLYTTAGKKAAVVVVVRDIPVGQTISRLDLSTVEVAGEVTAIAGTRLDTAVGQRAAVELLPGTLLQRAMLASGPVLDPGQAKVGVAVKGGQLPADGLTPGDVVQVLRLPSQQQQTTTGAAAPTPLVLAKATVFSAKVDPAQAGGYLITVTVPADQAPAVAAASGAGLAALVQVGS